MHHRQHSRQHSRQTSAVNTASFGLSAKKAKKTQDNADQILEVENAGFENDGNCRVY